MARAEITPQTLIRKGMDGKWVPAQKIQGLFPGLPPAVPVVEKSQTEFPSALALPEGLPLIKPSELPDGIRSKLQSGEKVHHFGYIDSEGGCANPSMAKQWLLVTDKRILFEASVKQGTSGIEKFNHQSGSIPMAKVSYVGTSTSQDQQGCANDSVTNLAINSSGGQIILAIPTKQEAERAQGVIDGVISAT